MNLSENRAALELFERALELSSWSNIEQTFSARSGGIAAAGTGDWSKAESLFLTGKSLAAGIEHMKPMAMGLLADAAFARWKQGKAVESLELYSEVLKLLETIPIDDNLKNRHLHAIVRHSLLWIAQSDDTSRNNVSEPLPGACSNQEPHEGFKDLKIIDMPAIWGMLGSIDTKLGTGLELAKMAKERCGKLPLLMEISQRYSSYQALFNNINTPSAISVIIAMYESLQCEKPLEDKKLDGWSATDIPPLPPDYWNLGDKREQLLHILLSIAITATCYDFTSPLPVDNWRHDLNACGIKGEDINEFIDIFIGREKPKSEELLHAATNCLYRLREEALSPQELFAVHFRLFNFLATGQWGQYSGEQFADFLSRQWRYVAERQLFALISPKLYLPQLNERCLDTILSGYSKAASILEVASQVTGVGLSKAARELLSQIKDRKKS